MRSILFSVFVLATLFSCKEKSISHEQQQPAVPVALQDEHKSSGEFFSKSRAGGSLVEDLYDGLVKDQKPLKDIENRISDVTGSIDDSTGTFILFNNKNTSYYTEADQYVNNIKDSVLKEKIKELIQKSLSAYSSKSSNNTGLLKIIDTKKATLNDLHVALKLVKTLPVMEKYQLENMTSSKPMEGLIKKYDEVIYSVDSLSKK